ncbi:hypothetical protein [Novosphingobium beihaiensis]|uniref:Asl1-like glycosyl hydrolase catalytic domain-containing protein n=1 Tax=Novosphingobium beihaiensis TaxID=2930389 RepID=A0ABT0BUY4_9SPHN|nr:hypothetical protein [Novosphingobium beihaiensis]MCJ2188611.1 hypothetical protein [Novosphingobium beihaiensis]
MTGKRGIGGWSWGWIAAYAAVGAMAGAASRLIAADAPPPPPIQLGASSNFSQGWNPQTAQAALGLPVPRLRDSIRWASVEKTAGHYSFDRPTTAWPAYFANSKVRITLTLNWGNPLYDGGETPHSPRALAAFGRFAAAAVQRYPQIDTLEIGNEINGGNFVSGPVKAAGLAKRGPYHLAMVRAAAQAVRRVRPDVRVLGGSTHSLPAGFLWPLLDLPGAGAIEGLAVHPYTTPIDQLPAQIGLLRSHGPAARLPLHITEFGSQDPLRAADDLVRAYATLAALGAAEMDWYPLNERGDGLVPLVRRNGTLTGAGQAFRFVQDRLAGRRARDASPDRFTFVYKFGRRIAVVWGAQRAVSIDPATVTAFDATGAPLDPHGLSLRENRALVLIGRKPLTQDAIRLGCNPLVADSFYQFGYPAPGQLRAPGDGFDRFASIARHPVPFEVMPGQQRTSVPWTPYLGRSGTRALRLTADTVLPAVTGPDSAVVLRHTAARTARLHIVADFKVSPKSTDGILVSLLRNGHTMLSRAGTAPGGIDLKLNLRKGQTVAFAISPGATPRGDTTRYRIRIFDEGRCR